MCIDGTVVSARKHSSSCIGNLLCCAISRAIGSPFIFTSFLQEIYLPLPRLPMKGGMSLESIGGGCSGRVQRDGPRCDQHLTWPRRYAKDLISEHSPISRQTQKEYKLSPRGDRCNCNHTLLTTRTFSLKRLSVKDASAARRLFYDINRMSSRLHH